MLKKLLLHVSLLIFVLVALITVNSSGLAETQESKLLHPGSFISFGRTEQDGNLENGKEDILWQILSTEDDVLLISRYGLAVRPYDTKGWRGEEYHYPKNDLEQSDLYNWLNGEFLTESFTNEERNQISGDVSLLTCEEACNYFRSALERKVVLTPFAEGEAKHVQSKCYWWLRWTYETYADVWTTSSKYNTSDLPAYVSDAGLTSVFYMLRDSTKRMAWNLNDSMAVRPVIRIAKENLQNLGYSFSDNESATLSEKDFYPGANVVFGQIFNTDMFLNPLDTRYLHDGLDWTVLNIDKNGKALLISTYAVGGIGAQVFFEGSSCWQWMSCGLQEILNRWCNHQMNTHTVHTKEEPLFNFTEEEKKAIVGKARLLTTEEAALYFPDALSRNVKYWKTNETAFDWWILPNNDDKAEVYIVYFIDSGNPEGAGVTKGTGEVQTLSKSDFEANQGHKGVRPVIEVDLTVLFPGFNVSALQASPVEESVPEQVPHSEPQEGTSQSSSPLIGKWHMISASNDAVEPGIETFLLFDTDTLRIIRESGSEVIEDNATGYTVEGTTINIEGGFRQTYTIFGNTMRMESEYTDDQGKPVTFELSRVDADLSDHVADPAPANGSPLTDDNQSSEKQSDTDADSQEQKADEAIPAEQAAEYRQEPETVPENMADSPAQQPEIPVEESKEEIIQEPAEIHEQIPLQEDESQTMPISADGQEGAAVFSERSEAPFGEYSQTPDEDYTETIEQEQALDQTPDEEYTEEIEQTSVQESAQWEELPAATALPVNPLIDGKRQVPVSSILADSYITASKESYPPENMIDGEETTAWQFSTKQSKLKETYVYFSFPEPVTIDELWIKNGFWKITAGKDQYTRNCRIKELGISFLYADSADYADKQTIKLKDDKKRKDWQKIGLGIHKNVIGIRFRVMSVYRGSKFKNDVCVSEVMFMNSEQ